MTVHGQDGGTYLSVLLHQLARAPIGSLDGLLRCVRNDVFDWTWNSSNDLAVQSETAAHAAAVVCDAVAASYSGPELPGIARRRLGAPWLSALRRLSRSESVPRGPEQEPTGRPGPDSIVRQAGTLRVSQVEALRALCTGRAGSRSWAEAVHDASWAVHLTGRARVAAGAQFALVEALGASGLSPEDAAAGIWNLLSGAVQALSADDLLEGSTYSTLVDPVLEVLALQGDPGR